MAQLENEYGSYGMETGFCDVEYMQHLKVKARGNKLVQQD